MKQRLIRQGFFWGTLILGFAVYMLSMTEAVVPVKVAERHPLWGYMTEIFGGDYHLMSAALGAIACAILVYIVCRYLGWRLATCATLVLITFPLIWDSATHGGFRIVAIFLMAFGIWVANVLLLVIFRRAREIHDFRIINSDWWTGVVGYGFIVMGVVFAVTSLWFHEFRYGAAANAYAHGVVSEANGRWIMLSGIATDQIHALFPEAETVDSRTDDEYRKALVARVRAKWPGEEKLVRAAQISSEAFADALGKLKPEACYFMNGKSTTPSGWYKRWAVLREYLDVRGDEFIKVMRRAMAYEACAVANKLQDDNHPDEAWALYLTVLNEVEPENFSNLINMSEMLRGGYIAQKRDVQRVSRALENFFKDPRRARYMREIARLSGPVRMDPAVLVKIREETVRRLDELRQNHQPLPVPPEIKTLIEWNGDMTAEMDKGNRARAGRIARTILANPKWRNFVPANAVLGTLCGAEGDYEASAAFFEIALKGTNTPTVIVCNDYAETLRQLERFDAAEKYARIAVKGSTPQMWVARITLAEVLIDRNGDMEEARALLEEAKQNAPSFARRAILKLQASTFKKQEEQ